MQTPAQQKPMLYSRCCIFIILNHLLNLLEGCKCTWHWITECACVSSGSSNHMHLLSNMSWEAWRELVWDKLKKAQVWWQFNSLHVTIRMNISTQGECFCSWDFTPKCSLFSTEIWKCYELNYGLSILICQNSRHQSNGVWRWGLWGLGSHARVYTFIRKGTRNILKGTEVFILWRHLHMKVYWCSMRNSSIMETAYVHQHING